MARLSRLTSWFTKLVWPAGISRGAIRLTLLAALAWISIGAGTEKVEGQAFNAASISGQVSTPFGGPAASAQVRVCQITSGGIPCSALAVLYSDYNLVNRTPNPISTDQFGNYKAFLPAGLYLVQVTLAGGPTQPIYVYYVSAGAGGALSAPPAYSIQFASSANAGQFASDQTITINPTTHTTTSPIFYAPGGGTGQVQIGGATSGNYVTQTVDPNTGAWTFTWPTVAPTATGCLTVAPSGVGSIQTCPLGNFLPLTGGTLTGPLTGPTITTTGSINQAFEPQPTIQSAVTAAGTTGSVLVPAGYAGADHITSNPSGVQVDDHRPMSNLNSAIDTLYASQYGAVCNGGVDDTNAIQAAITAAYAYNLPTTLHKQMTVVLPQGSCLITHPLELGANGSLVGQDDTSYLVCDYAAWQGSDYHCLEMVGNGQIGGGASIGIRRIGGFGLIGISNASIPNTEAIFISNSANLYGPSNYAFRNISLDHILGSGFDTFLDAQDFADSTISNLNVSTVRVGLNFNGDAVNIQVSDSNIFDGSLGATSTTGTTYGMIVQTNTKYTNGSNICGSNLYCSPQGISVYHSNVLSFDTDLYQQQCVSCTYQNGAFDQAAGGPAHAGYAIQLGPSASGGGLQIINMTLGTFDPAGTILFSQMVGGQAWITGNYIYLDAPATTTSAIGINLTGSGTASQFSINDNKFNGLSYGTIVGQNLTYSSIRGNTGGATNTLIWLAESAGLVHTGTVVEENVDSASVLAVTEGDATGMRIGWNQSPTQFLGSQTAFATGCTFAAGTIGSKCATAVTISWPTAFADSSYVVQCSVQSPATGATGIGNAGIVDRTSILVNEVALDTVSTGGGTLVCTGQHF